MENISKLITEPFFWLCTVIFSIILGIISNLLTPHVTNYLDRKLASRKETKKRKQLRLLGQVVFIYNNPDLIINAKIDSIYSIGIAILILILSLFALVIGLVIQLYIKQSLLLLIPYSLTLAGIFLAWLGLYAASHGVDKIHIVRVAESRRNAASSYANKKGVDFNSKEVLEFYDTWDMEKIGVTMQEVLDDIQSRKAKSSS